MNRLFAALLLATAWLDAHAQSSLPQCPKDIKASWTNCFGTVTFEEGEFKGHKYVGEFRDDKYHGQGTYTFADGSKYVGGYRDGKLTGQGTATLATGEKYVGEFWDGKSHGQGTYTWPDGSKYVGEFRDGKSHGQGTHTWADGSKYVGEWRDDKYHGQGILYNVNGTVQESGMWRDGELLQSFAIDTAQSSPGASSGVEAKDSPTRKPRKRTSVEIVNDCLAKGLKPGTSQFSKCVSGQ